MQNDVGRKQAVVLRGHYQMICFSSTILEYRETFLHLSF